MRALTSLHFADPDEGRMVSDTGFNWLDGPDCAAEHRDVRGQI